MVGDNGLDDKVKEQLKGMLGYDPFSSRRVREEIPQEEIEKVIETLKKFDVPDSEVQEVRELFKSADVLNSSKQIALKYYEEAKAALNELKPVINDSELVFFDDLLNFVYERKF